MSRKDFFQETAFNYETPWIILYLQRRGKADESTPAVLIMDAAGVFI